MLWLLLLFHVIVVVVAVVVFHVIVIVVVAVVVVEGVWSVLFWLFWGGCGLLLFFDAFSGGMFP